MTVKRLGKSQPIFKENEGFKAENQKLRKSQHIGSLCAQLGLNFPDQLATWHTLPIGPRAQLKLRTGL